MLRVDLVSTESDWMYGLTYTIKEFPLFTAWGTKLMTHHREGTNDAGALISILVQDEYKLVKHGIKPGMTAIDLGAHVGAVSLALCTLGAKVVAVELVRLNAELCRRNLSLNGYKDTLVLDVAVGGVEGTTREVYLADQSTETGRIHHFIGTVIPHERLASPCKSAGATARVTKYTIEEIMDVSCTRHCNFLKMDIEGSEWEVFESIGPKVLDRIDVISGELHRLDERTIVHKEDLLPFLHNKFIDVTDSFETEYNKPGDVTHFVYRHK